MRDQAASVVVSVWMRGRAAGARLCVSGALRLGCHEKHAHAASRQLRSALRRNALALSGGLAVLIALPVGAGLLHGVFRVDSFDPTASRAIDERVAALLQGEVLVPPLPLPPEAFTTQGVEARLPLIRGASRLWDLLDEPFRQRLLLTFKLIKAQYGYDMVLVEGYRSPQRQAALAALGPSVTRAAPYESYHQYGLAADCAFLRDGHVVISEKDPWAMAGYARFAEVAKSLGLIWGGDWHGLQDFGHVELPKLAATAGSIGKH